MYKINKLFNKNELNNDLLSIKHKIKITRLNIKQNESYLKHIDTKINVNIGLINILKDVDNKWSIKRIEVLLKQIKKIRTVDKIKVKYSHGILKQALKDYKKEEETYKKKDKFMGKNEPKTDKIERY